MTDHRRKVFPLLFDQRHLSQSEIAKAVGISQPSVSQFVSLLIESNLIEQVKEGDKIIYHDKYDLIKFLQK